MTFQLGHFIVDASSYLDLNLSTMLELCQSLAKTRKSSTYYLIDKLFFFILTLPVSITTIERLFSTMKIIKTRLRNKMEDEFLADNMIIYIENKKTENFSFYSIIVDQFITLKEPRVVLMLVHLPYMPRLQKALASASFRSS